MNPKTLHKISYGLYVVCSKKQTQINGQIANAIIQVTADPATIALSINKQNLTHEYITESKIFTISVLSEKTSMKFIGTFGFKSGRDIDKFKNIRYKKSTNDIPIVLDNSLAYVEGEVINVVDVGTHTIFIGRVNQAEILPDESPMTYEYYHQVKGGLSPKTAPTYSAAVDKIHQKEEKKMDKFRCNVCGYVYDPEKGDPDANIEPGTAFDDLPDDWVCPVCGAPKEEFSKV